MECFPASNATHAFHLLHGADMGMIGLTEAAPGIVLTPKPAQVGAAMQGEDMAMIDLNPKP
jgi:hypothetical protein